MGIHEQERLQLSVADTLQGPDELLLVCTSPSAVATYASGRFYVPQRSG